MEKSAMDATGYTLDFCTNCQNMEWMTIKGYFKYCIICGEAHAISKF